MSSLQMPKVDNAIMSKKDKIASDLRGIINSKMFFRILMN